MDDKEAIQVAAAYLGSRRIRFEEPVYAVALDGATIEVVFSAEGTSDPNVVVDPPEVRVRVDAKTGAAELIPEM